jgi:hypothetical protein
VFVWPSQGAQHEQFFWNASEANMGLITQRNHRGRVVGASYGGMQLPVVLKVGFSGFEGWLQRPAGRPDRVAS